MPGLVFLKSYTGESLGDLIAMADTHRIDSLVLAMESALEARLRREGESAVSREDRVILAIEALEREVNNGGYGQFFSNASRAYAAEIEESLRLIGCVAQANIARRAVAALALHGPITPDAIDDTLFAGGEALEDVLNALDNEYYACEEPIADRLFAFVQENRQRIRLA